MSPPDPITAAESPQALSALNRWLAGMSAQERIAWAFESLAGPHALSTSFGVQSAVSLHLLTQAAVAGQLRLHVADPLQQKAHDVVVATEQRQTHVRRRHLDIVQRLAEAHRTTEDLPVAGGAGQRPMAKAHPQRLQAKCESPPVPCQRRHSCGHPSPAPL